MELTIRATGLQVTPSDSSGFLVRVECAQAEAVREQVILQPDDGAEDWRKRYDEICKRSMEERALLQEALRIFDNWQGITAQRVYDFYSAAAALGVCP